MSNEPVAPQGMAGADPGTVIATEMALNSANVRKWGTIAFGISAYHDPDVTVPTKFRELLDPATYLPRAWPTGVRRMGFITTDGLDYGADLSSNDTQMLQSLTPVRSDLESFKKTIAVKFGESNAFTQALHRLIPADEWAAEKDGGWGYRGERLTDLPDYTLWILGQDGAGSNAVFRPEVYYRARVADIGSRTRNRSDAETFDTTFAIFEDPILGITDLSLEDGPGKTPHFAGYESA